MRFTEPVHDYYVVANVQTVKTKEQGRQFKVLYHAFHKLFEVNRILGGGAPLVRSRGIEREFIMQVRNTKPTPANTDQKQSAAAATAPVTVSESGLPTAPFTFAELHRYATQLFELTKARFRNYRVTRADPAFPRAASAAAAVDGTAPPELWPEEANSKLLTEWLLKVRTVFQ